MPEMLDTKEMEKGLITTAPGTVSDYDWGNKNIALAREQRLGLPLCTLTCW